VKQVIAIAQEFAKRRGTAEARRHAEQRLRDGSGEEPLVTRSRADGPRAGGRETILVAEDEADLRDLVVAYLVSLGYEVLAAPDGPQAQEMATAHQGRIDLLLTDVVMPGISGQALGAAVGALRPGLPVVYMSGYSYDALGRQNLDSSAGAVLHKPFNRQTLDRTIRTALDRARTALAS
jgi:two-component system, cell cycle sensor histidine kinase and response regulator CckA